LLGNHDLSDQKQHSGQSHFFVPSVKCCQDAHGLSFHRWTLQTHTREETSKTASSRPTGFCTLIGKMVSGGTQQRNPGSAWPGRDQEVGPLTQSYPAEMGIQPESSKLLELNFRLCSKDTSDRKLILFRGGKTGKPTPSFSEPVFLCILQTLEANIFLPTTALKEEKDFSGIVFFPIKCGSG